MNKIPIFSVTIVALIVSCIILMSAGRSVLQARRSSLTLALSPQRPRFEFFFVIFGLPYAEACGGCVVMHFLAHELNRMYGHIQPVAYLGSDPNIEGDKPLATNPGFMTPLLPSWLDPADGVAVYPESVAGNPYNSKIVIRYVLYFPGIHGGSKTQDYVPEEIIVCWSFGYCQEFDSRFSLRRLYMVLYYFDMFSNLPKVQERDGILVLHKKAEWIKPDGTKIIRPEDGIAVQGQILPIGTPKRQRLEMFARAKMFVSFDALTFMSVEAAMVGCLSVVLPYPNVTREEWLASAGDAFSYGIAYGFDDITYAEDTLHKVEPFLRERALVHETELEAIVAEVQSRYRSLNPIATKT